MANTNNGNNITQSNVVTSNNMKNDGMRRRKQTTANSTTELEESKYVIPPACKYQGNVFSCMNGRLSTRYKSHILCTRDHDNEVGIASWDDLMMHRGYENPTGVITPMQYEKCPHCTKIVPSIQTSRKYHLERDHGDICLTLLNLDASAETNVIRDLLHNEKLYYTPTGYVTKLECKFGANCGNRRPEHLEKYTHPILSAIPIKHDCKFGANCGNRRSDHLEKYTHPILSAIPIKHDCKFGAACRNMIPEHLEKYTHPKKNCRFQPNCTNNSEAHCQQYVHTSATVLNSKTIRCGYYDVLE